MNGSNMRAMKSVPLTLTTADLFAPVGSSGKSTFIIRGFISSTISKRPARERVSIRDVRAVNLKLGRR